MQIMRLRSPLLLPVVLCSIAMAGACKKAEDGDPGPSGVPAATITITAAGVTPKNVDVPVGSRVRFVNNDNQVHYMHSDPHPDQNDCPELNQVGNLTPTQARDTGNLVVARVCGYHDHNLFAEPIWRGTITIR